MKVKRSPYFILGFCVALCAVGMLFLFFFSGISRRTPRQPFSRVIVNSFAEEINNTDIKYNSYYIAGTTGTETYLANNLAPLLVMKIGLEKLDTQRVILNLEGYKHRKYVRPLMSVDSPYFFVKDGTMPYILRGRVKDWRVVDQLGDRSFFTHAQPISASSFALRSVSKSKNENMLGKEGRDTVRYNYDLLQKQVDGIFCTDGMLHVDHNLSRVLYLYYYRNEYIVMDTNMNLLARANTIDTFKTANVKVGQLSETSTTMSIPQFPINKTSCVDGGYMYVLSALMAANEKEADFDERAVIDVYDIEERKYVFSFYLNERIQDFRVHGDVLVALFKNYFKSYQLHFDVVPRVFTRAPFAISSPGT